MAAAESDEQAIGDVEEIVAADIEIIPLLVDFADVVIVLENRVAAGVNRCAAVRFGERLEIGKTRGVHPAGRNDVSGERSPGPRVENRNRGDRKSTRLNSSHLVISYAVFCLKKKKHRQNQQK